MGLGGGGDLQAWLGPLGEGLSLQGQVGVEVMRCDFRASRKAKACRESGGVSSPWTLQYYPDPPTPPWTPSEPAYRNVRADGRPPSWAFRVNISLENNCLPLLLQAQHALTCTPHSHPPKPARLPVFSLLANGITTHPVTQVRKLGLLPVSSLSYPTSNPSPSSVVSTF